MDYKIVSFIFRLYSNARRQDKVTPNSQIAHIIFVSFISNINDYHGVWKWFQNYLFKMRYEYDCSRSARILYFRVNPCSQITDLQYRQQVFWHLNTVISPVSLLPDSFFNVCFKTMLYVSLCNGVNEIWNDSGCSIYGVPPTPPPPRTAHVTQIIQNLLIPWDRVTWTSKITSKQSNNENQYLFRKTRQKLIYKHEIMKTLVDKTVKKKMNQLETYRRIYE